ncbi:zinc finger protein 616 [Condylostylus longicornis]|uniref:zinc finger protein 616 n=1 Tax=Condylostylus longicornis TaxID=2530218 RepID=UPI00244DAA11|nr:zinc finger protein 616 [Condylostylus longicornis]
MDNQGFSIQWIPVENSLNVTNEEVITMEARTEEDNNVHNYIEMSSLPTNLDQIAAENLIYMAHDGHIDTICEDLIEEDPDGVTEHSNPSQIVQVYHSNGHNDNNSRNINEVVIQHNEIVNTENESVEDQSQYFECQVTTEEIITDDWVQQQGEERVEISVDQITAGDPHDTDDIDVPLPTDQDEYTALRPYPCDFCSKRFKKKLSLMNHMMAHKNDRPHICNFCGCRYMRRTDLLNHLKIHASMGDHQIDEFDENYMHLNDHIIETKPTDRRSADHYYDQMWDEVEAITSEYDRRKPSSKHKQNSNNNNSILTTKNKISTKSKKCVDLKSEIVKAEKVVHNEEEIPHYPILDERKPFVCQKCGIAFAREKALLSHKRIHANNSPSFECNNCNEIFYDIDSLNDHQRAHRFEESHSEYEPGQGDESDSNDSSKYGEFYCNICGMSFHRQDLLRRHSKSHIKKEAADNGYVGAEMRHCCNVCGENFSEALDLLAHAEIHARSQPFKCVLCGETFLEEATIKKHVSNVHSKELTTNSCVLCGKCCKDRKSLIKHAWEHSKEKNHSCSKCGKTFHNKARLNRHMVSHRNKTVICEVCQEEFPDGRSLMNHRHSHTNTSGKLFPCQECGKTFGSRSSQQIHIRIHTGERPYGCRYCWKAFADGGTLRKHERIHTGEKPYACSVCPRAFNQRVVLREHIRSHHSAVDVKRGTYYCPVCSSDLSNSTDLIQHLIQHSDMHTAMKRQPVTGPRKYKRRRKLKPHELERLRSEQREGISDIDYSDLDMGDVDDLLGITSKSKKYSRSPTGSSFIKTEKERERTLSASSTNRIRKYSNNSDKINSSSWQTKLITSSTNEDYNSVISNLENTLQNIDTLVVSNNSSSVLNKQSVVSTNCNENSSRLLYPDLSQQIESSKIGSTNNTYMNNTSKVSKINNVKNKKSNPDSYNGTSNEYNKKKPKMIHTQKTRISVEEGKRKTRTMITTKPVSIHRNEVFFNDDRKSAGELDVIIPDIITNRSPIRVKQENSYIESHPSGLTTESDLYNAQLLLEAASVRKEIEKYNPNVVNELDEILRSPDKVKSPQCDEIELEQKTEMNFLQSPISSNTVYTGFGCSTNEERRSSRSRRILPNRKYLEYETTPPRTTFKSQKNSSIKQNKMSKVKYEQKECVKVKNEPKYEENLQISNSHSNIQVKFEIEPSGTEITPNEKQISINDLHNALNNSNISADSSNGNDCNISPKKDTIIKVEASTNSFKCEMCSASFSDRAQLLVHVPIHI